MKKAVIMSVIGVVGAVVSTYGQGVTFGNYNAGSPIGNPISYANANVPAGDAGLAVGSDFSGELFYNNGAQFVAIPSSITPFLATDGDTADGAGYLPGVGVQIPGWTSGAVQVYFYAFNNVAISGDAIGTINGQSAVFSITPVVNTSPTYPDFSTTTYQSFTVATSVPEPATMALVGLGAAGLLAFRRRKA